MILINMINMNYSDCLYSRIVPKGSKAHELAEQLSQSITDLSTLDSNDTAEFENFESLLSSIDTYSENNLPCTIEEIHNILYQY